MRTNQYNAQPKSRRKYAANIAMFQLLKEHLEPKYFVVYDQKLRLLVETFQIKVYAAEVIDDVIKSITQVNSTNYMPYVKVAVIIMRGIIVVVGGLALIRYMFFDGAESAIQRGAELQQEGANLSLKTVNDMTEMAQAAGDLATKVADLSTRTGDYYEFLNKKNTSLNENL